LMCWSGLKLGPAREVWSVGKTADLNGHMVRTEAYTRQLGHLRS
jgi:hypothetical protein